MGATGMTEGSGPKAGWAARSCHHRWNLATLLLLLSWGVGGGVMAMPRGLAAPQPQFQDPASLPNIDEVAEIREHLANVEPQDQRLAMLYQLIRQYAAEAGAAGDARMAIPPPLLHSATGSLRAHPGHQIASAALMTDEGADDDMIEEENKPKRVSSAYMSLCHFKICNMGRKRNYRYNNQWVRV